MTEGKLYIGTSGWNYKMWQGLFYPENLSSTEYLRFYSEHFNTVEINSSFYHFPKVTTYKNWYSQTPEDFIFSVKAHRSITHIKKMVDIKEEWENFLNGAQTLKEKLGIILFQFPESFRCNEENFERIENFLNSLCKTHPRIAFEFRHISWDNEKITGLLKKHNAGWVIANSSRYPEIEKITGDFVYLRMHGPKELFASEYLDMDLRRLASRIEKWIKTRDVFVYFNNDFCGYAVKNSKELIKLCTKG